MTDTLVQHIDHPRLRKKFKSKTKFHDTSTLKDIESYVRTVQAPEEPQNYEFLIEILDKKAKQYILLDEGYLTSDQPFCQQNVPSASQLPIDYKDRVVNLKVQWIKKSAHDSASTSISLSNNAITHDVDNVYDGRQTQFHPAIQSLIPQDAFLPFHNSSKTVSQELNGISDTLRPKEDVDILVYDKNEDSAPMGQELTLSNDDRNWLNEYLNLPPNGGKQRSMLANQFNTPNLVVAFETIPPFNFASTQFTDTTNLLDSLSDSRYTTTDNTNAFLDATTHSFQHTETTSTNANRISTKFGDDTTETIVDDIIENFVNDVIIPSNMRNIQLLSDLSCACFDRPYQLSDVKVISDYQPNKALRFVLNMDKHQRLQYVSNRDPVKRHSRNGRSIVFLSGNKEGAPNKRAHILPKLGLPVHYKQMIDDSDEVIMCVACVKEYDIIETGETGYCVVANKKFLQFVNTEDEKQLDEVFIRLTLENTSGGIHELALAIIKEPHKIDNEIGPVLFKLSERYVRTASSHGFEFHQGNPSHRLALFLLKFDKQKSRFEPDWETLCLSDYIHQEKKQE